MDGRIKLTPSSLPMLEDTLTILRSDEIKLASLKSRPEDNDQPTDQAEQAVMAGMAVKKKIISQVMEAGRLQCMFSFIDNSPLPDTMVRDYIAPKTDKIMIVTKMLLQNESIACILAGTCVSYHSLIPIPCHTIQIVFFSQKVTLRYSLLCFYIHHSSIVSVYTPHSVIHQFQLVYCLL